MNGRTVSCGEVVIATHNPLVGFAGLAGATLFQTKLALYSTYVVAGRAARGSVPDALFWDTADPYHYLRVEPRREFDVVILGGEDHKTGQEADTERVLPPARAAAHGAGSRHRADASVVGAGDRDA